MAPHTPRTCGTCTMCCKVYQIAELNKQEGRWCTHCAIGRGCTIYDDRPQRCRDFFCVWVQDESLPQEWKPETCKMVLSVWPSTGFIYVQVDHGTPMAWRKEPYFSQLKLMAERLLKDRRHILVFVNRQATLIMPTGPVPIGEMSPQDGFVVRETFTAQGKHYIAERVPQRGGSGAGQDACSS